MTVADDLRGAFLTSSLTEEQRTELVAVSQERTFEPDEVLFEEGRPADVLWILLDGQHRADPAHR